MDFWNIHNRIFSENLYFRVIDQNFARGCPPTSTLFHWDNFSHRRFSKILSIPGFNLWIAHPSKYPGTDTNDCEKLIRPKRIKNKKKIGLIRTTDWVKIHGISNGISDVGEARTPSQHFSIFSIRSPTSLPPSAHAREIRRLISFIWYSMYLDSVCHLAVIESNRHQHLITYQW